MKSLRGKNENQTIGKIGEKIAQEYLISKGYQLLALNFRFHKLGEIDIIAREKEVLCIVEVKTRRSLLFGAPSEAVHYKKQERMRKLAYVFLKQHRLEDANIRFDIIEILFKNSDHYEINHIQNAF